MRVAAERGGDAVLSRERGRPLVVRGEGLARVERLDAVGQRPQTLECRTADAMVPVARERMRDAHEPALFPDTGDRLLAGQPWGDRSFEEETNDVAVGARDLLADDEPVAVRELAQPQRAPDRVVIGREHDVEAGLLDARSLDADRREAVRRCLAVRVHVDADPPRGHVRIPSPGALPLVARATIARMRCSNNGRSKRRADARRDEASKPVRSASRTAAANASGVASSTSRPSTP